MIDWSLEFYNIVRQADANSDIFILIFHEVEKVTYIHNLLFIKWGIFIFNKQFLCLF